jgi:hypothetical protein
MKLLSYGNGPQTDWDWEAKIIEQLNKGNLHTQ